MLLCLLGDLLRQGASRRLAHISAKRIHYCTIRFGNFAPPGGR
jgi:hypothetical protein